MTKLDHRPALIACVLALATLAVYFQVGGLDFTDFDDPSYVFANPRIVAGLTWTGVTWAFTHAHAANWHPLTSISHMLDCQLFGPNPGGPHVINLLLHMLNGVVLFGLLRRLTGSVWRSAAVAALFALHPLHVESVAWVSERKDVLSTLFGLLCLHAYAKYAEIKSGAEDSPGSSSTSAGPYYRLALLLFALGLMSKPMLVTLPCLLLLLDCWPLGRFSPATLLSRPAALKPLVSEKIPFFALSATSCVVTFLVQKAGGAVAPLDHLPLTARLGNAIVSYVRYLGKCVWPSDLCVLYPYQDWSLLSVVLALGGLVGLTFLVLRQREQRPYLLVGWAWYLGSLVPVIGLAQVGCQAIADRYTYLPSIGLFVMLAWGLGEVVGPSKGRRLALAGLATLTLVIFGILTQAQVMYWQNTETLFRHAIAVTSRNASAYVTLGRYFGRLREGQQAERCYRTALGLDPRSHTAWNNLACVLIDQGRFEEGLASCQQALRSAPTFAEAHNNLGTALLKSGKPERAVGHYTEALRLNPDYEEAHYNVGNALVSLGNLAQALEHYRAALEINPRSANARNNCGLLLAAEGRFHEAIVEFKAALALDPGLWQAHYGMGDALAKLGQHGAAVTEFRELLKVRPDDAAARQQLALCQTALLNGREVVRAQTD
jgi:protein O-mannosyl-transferase